MSRASSNYHRVAIMENYSNSTSLKDMKMYTTRNRHVTIYPVVNENGRVYSQCQFKGSKLRYGLKKFHRKEDFIHLLLFALILYELGLITTNTSNYSLASMKKCTNRGTQATDKHPGCPEMLLQDQKEIYKGVTSFDLCNGRNIIHQISTNKIM